MIYKYIHISLHVLNVAVEIKHTTHLSHQKFVYVSLNEKISKRLKIDILGLLC